MLLKLLTWDNLLQWRIPASLHHIHSSFHVSLAKGRALKLGKAHTRGVFVISGTSTDAATWYLCVIVEFSPGSGSGSGLPQTRGGKRTGSHSGYLTWASTKGIGHWAVLALQPEYLHRFNFYTLIKEADLFHEADLEPVSAPVEVGRDFSVDVGAVSEEMHVMQKRVLGFTGGNPWNDHYPFWCNVKPQTIISMNF